MKKIKKKSQCIWVNCNDKRYWFGFYCKQHLDAIKAGYFPEIDKKKRKYT